MNHHVEPYSDYSLIPSEDERIENLERRTADLDRKIRSRLENQLFRFKSRLQLMSEDERTIVLTERYLINGYPLRWW